MGGMPQFVDCYLKHQNLYDCAQIAQTLVEAYRYDFVKYGKGHQIKYLEILFTHIPQQLGKKFKYSLVQEYRKRELEPCVRLLVTASVIHEVLHTSAQGVPLGAQADLNTFKLFFLDVALSQFLLDLKPGDWMVIGW